MNRNRQNVAQVNKNQTGNIIKKPCGHIANTNTNAQVLRINCPHKNKTQSPTVQNSTNSEGQNTVNSPQSAKLSVQFTNQVQAPQNKVAEPSPPNNKSKDVKRVKNASPGRQKPPKPTPAPLKPPPGVPKSATNESITEIFKRTVTEKSSNEEPTNSENLSFQKVTQELADIIKNFQKQIHEVPIAKAKLEEIPSAMMQPKIKEFFKKSEPPVQQNQQTNKNQAAQNNKSGNNNNGNKSNQNNNGGVKKQTSLRSFTPSNNTMANSSSVRRFSSSTNHALTLKSSSSSTTSSRLCKRSSFFNVDPLKQLKDEVHKAIRDRKTFTVRGHFRPIRKALLERGWVEKFHVSYKDQLSEDLKRYQNYSINELLPLMRREDLTNLCKNLIKSKLLGGYQVDFYWGTNDDAFKENPDKIKYTMINKLKREIFSYTNKQGLCDASKNSYWYQKSDVAKLNHPRSYSLGKNGDLKGFVDDFNVTAAMSLLKWVVKVNMTKESKLLSPSGKIPLETFDFALNECCKFIKKGRHEDIDVQIPEATENEWNQFLEYFYKIVHYSNHFKSEGTETEDSLVRKSNYILNSLRGFYPFLDMDGMMNIWILKPTASSRGRGIHMCRTLQYVLKIVKQNSNIRYIIQKYIERPLLIYNTKFDIRQWFLISNCSPLTIWMYKECYLRFSSQTYNLRKLHESIHLTNNSVQCKYKNASLDTALPSYNMWDSNDFQRYLANIGYPNSFKDIVYAGMKQSITAAVMMHQDKMVVRRNSFELYGADFILTEDFQPWLLEINSNPALFASTPVTARMCPKVLEDVVKVVIDYGHNNKASTGLFELIYKEPLTKLPPPATLELKGLPLQSNYFFNAPDQKLNEEFSGFTFNNSNNSALVVDEAQDCLKTFGEEIKKTLKNLLQIIHNEKEKREAKLNQNLKSVTV
ncbi:tubulin glycylase 3B-like isoform X2 [Tribolium madens]|nr:tubulin glycylase 3B-like isoform X2 [Tribolium madens]